MSRANLDPAQGVWVSVVIPAYNEARRIAPTLEAWAGFAATRDGDVEIIVVDDGSTDGTAEVVSRASTYSPAIRLLRLDTNRGKGYSVRAGLAVAQGSYVCYSDADLPVDPSVLTRFVAALRDNPAEIAVAARASWGPKPDVPMRRALASMVFRWLVRAVALSEVFDSQCGFKVLDRAAIAPLLPTMTMDGFAFDIELLRMALDAGLRVVELSVQTVHREGSTVRLRRDVPPMLLDLFRIAIRRRSVRRPARSARWANVF